MQTAKIFPVSACIVSTKTYITNISANLKFSTLLINLHWGETHKLMVTCLLINCQKRNNVPLVLKKSNQSISSGVYQNIILVHFVLHRSS